MVEERNFRQARKGYLWPSGVGQEPPCAFNKRKEWWIKRERSIDLDCESLEEALREGPLAIGEFRDLYGQPHEILGLRWRDLDLQHSRLSVVQTLVAVKGVAVFGEPKTQRSARSVQLDTATTSTLRHHRTATLETQLREDSQDTDHDLVFTRAGMPIPPPWVSRRFPKLAESAGLPRIRFHDLRHTWATLALANGIHPKIVSERLGHSSIAITLDTYSHVTATLHSNAAEQVASLLIPTESQQEQADANNLRHLDGTSGHLSQ